MKLRIIFTTTAQRKATGSLIVGEFENLINTALQCGDRGSPLLINRSNGFPE
jgi:hypothetical protein